MVSSVEYMSDKNNYTYWMVWGLHATVRVKCLGGARHVVKSQLLLDIIVSKLNQELGIFSAFPENI